MPAITSVIKHNTTSSTLYLRGGKKKDVQSLARKRAKYLRVSFFKVESPRSYSRKKKLSLSVQQRC